MDASTNHPIDETLFSFDDFSMTRGDFHTLRSGEIFSTFIDVWALRLTLLNTKRALGKPKCIYFSTLVHLQLDPTEQWMKNLPLQKRKENFNERLQYEISKFGNLDVNDADLIFFPVLRHEHYFIVYINTISKSVEIIENKMLPKDVTEADKYEDCPSLLMTALKEYLTAEKSPLLRKIQKLPVSYLAIPWKELDNVIDCGIYVMRHMESYKGNVQDWDSGFKIGTCVNADFLWELRVKYA
ncbi:PREDICTED: uncharacterized protein LOC109163267 [Ipomoea nil]|uniref:uncharacterized protein LOC109163267 n=1 Tax=Ipomoea nil TaxID=35883 RepID=UPI000901A433|nr:PREDICTED: uncharacterized protein LOC109163267 [Ipomoea nil]